MIYDTQNLISAHQIAEDEASKQKQDLVDHAYDLLLYLKTESSTSLHNRIDDLVGIIEHLTGTKRV